MKAKVPLLVQDVEKMRDKLSIPAFDRVRVILDGGADKLRIDLECTACEDLLEWDPAKGWWVCPVCRQETTEAEMGDLLHACHAVLGDVLGCSEADEPKGSDVGETQGSDEGKGIGRWVRRLMGSRT